MVSVIVKRLAEYPTTNPAISSTGIQSNIRPVKSGTVSAPIGTGSIKRPDYTAWYRYPRIPIKKH
jgi:hypothetical protein